MKLPSSSLIDFFRANTSLKASSAVRFTTLSLSLYHSYCCCRNFFISRALPGLKTTPFFSQSMALASWNLCALNPHYTLNRITKHCPVMFRVLVDFAKRLLHILFLLAIWFSCCFGYPYWFWLRFFYFDYDKILMKKYKKC